MKARIGILLLLLAAWLKLTAAERPPNILLIVADDTGYGDLSAHGHPILRTPQLDRLHRESVRFTDFHVSPTCAPTRSALLTGRHEFKNGVTHTILERERLAPSAVTLAEGLRKAGYTTGIFGKWHLGDEPRYQPNRRGFDEVFIHGGGGIGQTYPGSCGDAPGNRYFDPAILHNGRFEKTRGFCTDIFTTQAISWMGTVKQRSRRPFFCYVPFNAAHAPLSCTAEYRAPYLGLVPDQTATLFGMIANIDANVGRMLDQLGAWGIDRETLVIYLNDNGGDGVSARVFNAGMRGSKNTPWLGGTRATGFWRWPGRFQPREVAALTAHIDFFPTLIELAGGKLDARARAQIEGRSLVPLLRNTPVEWPERTLFTHIGRWPKGTNVNLFKYSGCSVRSGPWHLVSDGNERQPRAKGWQLFQVFDDPGERTDVSSNHPDVVARLDTEYDHWWADVVPRMVNERAQGPEINPFKALYWRQFGGGPPAGKPSPRSRVRP